MYVDGALHKLDGIYGVHGKLGANGNSAVLEIVDEQVSALPEFLDRVKEAGETCVVAVGPAEPQSTAGDGPEVFGFGGIDGVGGFVVAHGG